jgi:hypothetical protein
LVPNTNRNFFQNIQKRELDDIFGLPTLTLDLHFLYDLKLARTLLFGIERFRSGIRSEFQTGNVEYQTVRYLRANFKSYKKCNTEKAVKWKKGPFFCTKVYPTIFRDNPPISESFLSEEKYDYESSKYKFNIPT